MDGWTWSAHEALSRSSHTYTYIYTIHIVQGLDFSKDLLVFAADAGVEGTLKTLGYKTYRHDAFGDFSPAEHKA